MHKVYKKEGGGGKRERGEEQLIGVRRSMMTLYTQNITLTEITANEFYRRKEFWRRAGLHLHHQTIPAAVEDPIIMPLVSDNPTKDYMALFEMLLDHLYTD